MSAFGEWLTVRRDAVVAHVGEDGEVFVQRVRLVEQHGIGDHVRLDLVVPHVGEEGATFVQSACAPC